MKVAFVTPFYGKHAAGGAESECRETAIRLAARGIDVEILTTCLLDLQHDWNIDAHPCGDAIEDGVCIRRFRAEKIDRPAFDRLNAPLMRGDAVSSDHARQFAALHINSEGLYRHLAAHASDFDWICFIPYLFGTSMHGSRLCAEKSILIPCLHDEGYARLEPVREMFQRVARIVFHTPAEARLAANLYGTSADRGLLIGEGVDTERTGDTARFRRAYGIDGPFMLCAGRKDASKNTPMLVDSFARYHARHRDDFKLVLVGPGSVSIPEEAKDAILDLGFVSRQDKLDAYAAASIFCQPSLNESFSLVLMEAWDLGCPALVHSGCDVTRDHVVAAGGGLHMDSPAVFAAAVDYLRQHPGEAKAMGEAGRRYVRTNFAWEHIIDRYVNEVFAPRRASVATTPPATTHR